MCSRGLWSTKRSDRWAADGCGKEWLAWAGSTASCQCRAGVSHEEAAGLKPKRAASVNTRRQPWDRYQHYVKRCCGDAATHGVWAEALAGRWPLGAGWPAGRSLGGRARGSVATFISRPRHSIVALVLLGCIASACQQRLRIVCMRAIICAVSVDGTAMASNTPEITCAFTQEARTSDTIAPKARSRSSRH